MNTDSLIDLKNRVAIETVIKDHTDLYPAGDLHLVGKCPFSGNSDHHNLIIYLRNKVFFCYRCNEAGDVICFISRKMKKTVLESFDYLKSKYLGE